MIAIMIDGVFFIDLNKYPAFTVNFFVQLVDNCKLKTMSAKFKNLIDVARYFSNEDVCHEHLAKLRWKWYTRLSFLWICEGV